MTTKIQLDEATLVAPAFSGDDSEVMNATQVWSSVISSVSQLGTNAAYGFTCSVENRKAILSALMGYLTSKLEEINNVTPPPTVTSMAPQTQPTVVAPVACAPTDTAGEVVVNYTEALKPNPVLKRMRELAGIAHEQNRV